MVDTTYQLETANYGDITVNHVQNAPNEINNVNIGDTLTAVAQIDQGGVNKLVVDSWFTYTIPSGTTETYTKATVNGTLSVDGTLRLQESTDTPFQNTLQYNVYAGEYTTTKTLNGQLRYREFIPDNSDIGTLVVGLTPNTELQNEDIRGVWGLIEGITDNRTSALTNDSIEIQIRVLAQYGTYTSISDVQTELEV